MSPAVRLVVLVLCTTLSVAVARAASPSATSVLSGEPLLAASSDAAGTAGALREGQPAPDFDLATSYGWRRFHDVCRMNETVLLFGAGERMLALLQSESEAFRERGVAIYAVRGSSDGENWETLQRLGLTYALIADPEGYIDRLYGVASAATTEAGGCWVLVDRKGIVRATGAAGSDAPSTDILARIRGDRPILEAGESR